MKHEDNVWHIRALATRGYRVVELSATHFRVEGIVDIYPVNARWHNLVTGQRGHYKYAELCVERSIRAAVRVWRSSGAGQVK